MIRKTLFALATIAALTAGMSLMILSGPSAVWGQDDPTLTPTPTPVFVPPVIGRDWAQATCNALWGAREGFDCVYHLGKLWLVGGLEHTLDGDVLRGDVWSSADGRQWDRVDGDASFGPRRGHRVLVHDGVLWVIGGVDADGNTTNGVWRAIDNSGSSWFEVHNIGDRFPPLTGFAAAVFNTELGSRMWVIGGANAADGTLDGSLWSSQDGTSWDLLTQNRLLAREGAETVYLPGLPRKIVLVGGKASGYAVPEIASSTDGVAWIVESGSPSFGPRVGHATAYRDELWLVGGRDPLKGGPQDDVWKTDDWDLDGFNEITSEAPFGSREGHRLVSGGGVLWLIGGSDGSRCLPDVWFTSSQPGFEATLTAVPTCELTPTPTPTPTPTFEVVLYSTLDWVRAARGIGFPGGPDYYFNAASAVFDAGDGPRMWVVAGSEEGREGNAVFSSSDGSAWEVATADPGFMKRYGHTALSYGGRLWVYGGDDGLFWSTLSDIWSSADGSNWNLVASEAGCGARRDHSSVVFDAGRGPEMWVLGGETTSSSGGRGVYNDVWYSSDGFSWNQAAESAAFGYRYSHSSAVFDAGRGPEMWVIGGMKCTVEYWGFHCDPANDVWHSLNGVDWECATTNAVFGPRFDQRSVSYDGRIWVIGGNDESKNLNDVYSSEDGVNWREEPGFYPFNPAAASGAMVYDAGDGERIWLVGADEAWFSTLGLLLAFNPEDCGSGDPGRLCNARNPADGGRVGLKTGNLFHETTDLFIPNRGVPFRVSRAYNSQSHVQGLFGRRWSSPLDEKIEFPADGRVLFHRGDGALRVFQPDGSGGYLEPKGYDAKLGYDGEWSVKEAQGFERRFDGSGRLLWVSDRNGNRLYCEYNDIGDLQSITDGRERRVTFQMNANGLVERVTDTLGRTWFYRYNLTQDLVGVDHPGGITALYEYDKYGLMTHSRDPKYRKGFRDLRYEYDAKGRVVRESDSTCAPVLEAQYLPDGDGTKTMFRDYGGGGCGACGSGETTYYFNAEGVWTGILDAGGNVTSLEFDDDLNRTSLTDALGRHTASTYDGAGNLLTLTDAMSGTASSIYEPTFNQVQSATDALGRTVEYSYDGRGNLTYRSAPLGAWESHTCDENTGDRLSTTDANSHATTYGYDDYGNLVSVTDAEGNATSYTYDAAGRLATQIDAKGNVTSYTWDNADRLVRVDRPEGSSSVYAYDDGGNLTTRTDPDTYSTTYAYDQRDRLTGTTDARSTHVGYQYDAVGNLIILTDGNGHSTLFEYDSLNRLTRKTDPNGISTSYLYDAVGNLIRRTDGRSQVTQYQYDPLDRLSRVHYPDWTGIQNGYDAVGNLLSRYEDHGGVSGSSQMTYDDLNRLTYKRDLLGNELHFAYDPVGNLTTLTYPDGREAQYGYTAVNRTEHVDDPEGRRLQFTYDRNLNLSRVQFPNGIVTDYSYDGQNRLLTIQNAGEVGGAVPDYAYQYDPAGNRIGITRDGKVGVFSYDPVHQLVSATMAYGDPATPKTLAQSYTFDSAGNRVQFIEDGRTTGYVHDAANQLISRSTVETVGALPGGTGRAYAAVRAMPLPRPTPASQRVMAAALKPEPPAWTKTTWGRPLAKLLGLIPQPKAAWADEAPRDLIKKDWDFKRPSHKRGHGGWGPEEKDTVTHTPTQSPSYTESPTASWTWSPTVEATTTPVTPIVTGQVSLAPTVESTPAGEATPGITKEEPFSRLKDRPAGWHDRDSCPHGDEGHGGSPCDRDPCQLRCDARSEEVFLSWMAAGKGIFRNPDGYRVYRRAKLGGQWAEVAVVDDRRGHLRHDGISFVERPGAGEWCYQVKAFREHPFEESGFTNECCVEVGAKPTATFTKTLLPTPIFTSTFTFTPPSCPHKTKTPFPTHPPCPHKTKTHTPEVSATWTTTATDTWSPAPTYTWTETPSFTWMPTPSPTNTETFTHTSTETPTNTPTDTSTETPTDTSTDTLSATATDTDTSTETPTETFTETPTWTLTPSPTNTSTDTATDTPTDTPSSTATFTFTDTPTDTETETPTSTSTFTCTSTDTPTETPMDTQTNTFTDTVTNTCTSTDTETATSTATVEVTPIETPTSTVTTECLDVQYQYDNNGNMIREDHCGQVTYFEYDYENRIKRITYPDGKIEDYLYDYSGNLLMKISGGETTQYTYGFGVAPLAEKKGPTDGPVTETTLFIQANGKTYEKLVNSEPSFMYTDALGSVVAISDGAGTVTNTYEYEPYGRLLYSKGNEGSIYQFVGSYGVRSISGNKSVMGLRVYDRETGKFIHRDPIGFWGGLNIYRYMKNNPLRFIDPMGLADDNKNEVNSDDGDFWDWLQSVISDAWENLSGDSEETAANDSSSPDSTPTHPPGVPPDVQVTSVGKEFVSYYQGRRIDYCDNFKSTPDWNKRTQPPSPSPNQTPTLTPIPPKAVPAPGPG